MRRKAKSNGMKKITQIALVGAACLATAVVAWPQAADDPLDSLKICPDTQKLMFENKFVRVIDDEIPVGVTEPKHHHRHGVVVIVSPYLAEDTREGQKPVIGQRYEGAATWADDVIHTVKNVGKTKTHAVRIELKF
jgi:hypothetical protein